MGRHWMSLLPLNCLKFPAHTPFLESIQPKQIFGCGTLQLTNYALAQPVYHTLWGIFSANPIFPGVGLLLRTLTFYTKKARQSLHCMISIAAKELV
jgi:hypothetical protein